MAYFAPVAPIHVVNKLAYYSSGDYHLLLAHDVANKPQEYGEYFNAFNCTIIMDNSVIELGGAVDLGTVKKAVDAVRCATVVLPDVLLDTKATVEACKAALIEWPKVLGPSVKYMYVPQGTTLEAFAYAAEELADAPGINYWGVPRNLVGAIGTRREAIEIVHALNSERKIHMLGFSENLIDDFLCASNPKVYGIDSAVPLRAASLGLKMSYGLKLPPRGDWWDTAVHNKLMEENIDCTKKLIRRK